MNGKLARALRRSGEGVVSEKDLEIPISLHERREKDRKILIRLHERREARLKIGPKFPKERQRKQAAGHGPTWPATKDQRKQSRPLIVEKPVRQLRLQMLLSNPKDKSGMRYLTAAQIWLLRGAERLPKHMISNITPSVWRKYDNKIAAASAASQEQ